MTVYASFDAQTQYEPADLMQRDADWISPGVVSLNDLQVTAQSPAAMAVNVSGAAQGTPGGSAWLASGYRIYNDSTLAITIAAANSTNPRIDIVVIGVNTSTNPYTPEIKVVTGNPGATPAAPTTPAGYLLLAQVYVAANTTSISQANITDERVIASLIIPQASASKLGGVKVGSGLSIAGDGTLSANVQTINNATPTAAGISEVTQGVTGTPVVSTRVADQEAVTLSTTAATTVATFTPTVNGFFDIACHFRLTANASVGITVSYAGSQGTLTTTILNTTDYTFNSAAGADNDYDTIPVTIRAVAGTAINVQFTASVASAVVASANIVGR